MSFLIKAIASAVLAGVIFIGGIWVAHNQAPTQAPLAGSFTPVGGQTYALSGAGVTASQTTVPLTSFTTPDGRAITMTMVGTVGYAVIDPNSPTRIEDITFSGITQNANGTAILTGVTRGNDFVAPYNASSTLAQAHSGGAYLILSNSAGFYGQQFALVNASSSITGAWIFSPTAQPAYSSNPVSWSSQNSLINKAYADALSIQGAATSTEANLGIVQLANSVQIGSSTASSTPGGPLVIPNRVATTSPGTQCTVGACVVSSFTNALSPSWFGTSASFFYAVGNLFATNASSTNATSTSAMITGAAFGINSINYRWPSTQTASGTVLTTDNLNNLTWTAAKANIVANAGTSTLTTTTNASTTLQTIVIPANSLGPNGNLAGTWMFSTNSLGSNCFVGVNYGNGAATTSIWAATMSPSQVAFSDVFTIYATSTSGQIIRVTSSNAATIPGGNNGASSIFRNAFFGAYDLTAKTYIQLLAKSDSTEVCSLSSYTFQISSQ